MDVVEVKEVLEACGVPGVADAFRASVPEAGMRKFDREVLEYLLRMLEGQCTPESFLAEEMIAETLALYLLEYGVCATEAEAGAVAGKVNAALERAGLAKKPRGEPARLAAAVSIGKAFEDNVRRSAMAGTMARVTVNTNNEWTWDSKRSAAKDDRRRKKEEEKKAMLREEYEEFLKKRGVANAHAVVKLHNRSEGAAASYSTDIRCEDIHIHMGKQVLLDHANLQLLTGHKYALVGRNGMGKTTLLRALCEGELEGVSPFVQILHVEQEIVAGSESPLEVLLAVDVERTALLAEEQELLRAPADDEAAASRLRVVYERLDAIDSHSAEARASAILHGLSFTREMMRGPTKALSGGWRMRVALARALFVEPDILLLDEPTNHLDLEAVIWLEGFLQDWSKTFVVVSHSRTFLNNVCTEVIHLDQFRLHYYTGNYDAFERTRCDQLRLQARQFEAQEKQRAHMQAFVDRFRYNASKAKMAQSRIKQLEKMATLAPVMADAGFSFRFPDPEPVAGQYLQFIDVEFGYKPGVSLFKDVNFGIDDQSRLVLVGANGAGKSTFLALAQQKMEPRSGQVLRNPKIRLGHFAQHHLESLIPQQSAVEFMRGKFPHVDEQQIRAHLGGMGLPGDKALQPIYTLSGGQKSRLALAWITFTKPHLLLLDEPTNHLDLETVNALVQALLEFKGGLLVVSHDEHFITSLCDEIYSCADERVGKFDGDFLEYKSQLIRKMRAR